jgi:hypothetical protein
VEGFPYMRSQFAVGAVLVDLPACMLGTPFWGALGGFGFVYQLISSFYCIRSHHIL